MTMWRLCVQESCVQLETDGAAGSIDDVAAGAPLDAAAATDADVDLAVLPGLGVFGLLASFGF